jgi:hypothetical protein
MKRHTFSLFFFFLTCMVISCSLLTPSSSSNESPANAAKEFANALANWDSAIIADRACAAQLPKIQQVGTWAFGIFGVRTEDPKATIDVSGLKFSTTSTKGDSANVHVFGPIHYRLPSFGKSEDGNYDDTWPMVLENEKWKWCGYVAPGM